MKLFLCLLACLCLTACSSETQDSKTDVTADDATQQVATETMNIELATYNVTCGCSLEEVGHCGNYIEVDSKYVEIANGEALGLGKMEWCQKEGVQVAATGEVIDGKFVAATLVEKK